MKHKFKVGDKVVCIDDGGNLILKAGKTYEVSKLCLEGNEDEHMVYLKGLRRGQNGWFVSRFQLASASKSLTARIRRTRNGGFRVNLVGANGEKMFTSEVYTTKAAAKETLRHFPDFEIVDEAK